MQLVNIIMHGFWQSLMILLVITSFVTNDLILVGLAAGCEIIALIFLAIVSENAMKINIYDVGLQTNAQIAMKDAITRLNDMHNCN